MAQAHSLVTFVSAVLATFALTTFSYGQSAPPAQNAVQAPSKAQTAVPVTMTECEGTNNCATWTFLGAQGNGQWPSGEIANLSIERYDDNTVMIRRADSTGASAGLTAVYTGTRHGDRVGGEFTSSWPGHWQNKAGNWYAMVEVPVSPPNVMHGCTANCYTLLLQDGKYIRTDDPDETWTIERFTRGSVILHRHNPPAPWKRI